MLSGKPINATALFITAFEGYGDLVYHTPTIRILSKIYKNVDVLCKNPDPFLNNPCIKTLKTFTQNVPQSIEEYQKNIFIVTVDSIIFFPHSSIHTVDLVSIKTLRRVLLDKEKTLEAYWTDTDLEHVRKLLWQHPLAPSNKLKEGRFVVLSPSKTWESRTLPLLFYQQIIAGVQKRGFGVVLVGKDVDYSSDVDINKTLYDSNYFPTAVCLYNQLTFAQLCALYSITPIAINSENGNNPISCTNDFCWNLYIPTLTAPEFRLPFRQGSQKYRTAIAANAYGYYPSAVYGEIGVDSYEKMPILLPKLEHVLSVFERVVESIDKTL